MNVIKVLSGEGSMCVKYIVSENRSVTFQTCRK